MIALRRSPTFSIQFRSKVVRTKPWEGGGSKNVYVQTLFVKLQNYVSTSIIENDVFIRKTPFAKVTYFANIPKFGLIRL